MSKPQKEISTPDENAAFEMIELSCNELDQLTRAFKVIETMCAELTAEVEAENSTGKPFILH